MAQFVKQMVVVTAQQDGEAGGCACKCGNGAVCTRDGTCECMAGWRGRYCDEPCPEGFWGAGCRNPCTCNIGESCDSMTGRCACKCENGGVCNRDGTCECMAGWRGRYCDEPCPEGFWGAGCRNPCTCHIGESCDPVRGTCDCRCENGGVCERDGMCECMAGWRGRYCDEPCPEGFWGAGCTQQCICPNLLVCDDITGICKCQCQNGGTCNQDGICECTGGWRGRYCDVPCPSGFWGAGCTNHCNCQSSVTCDIVTGRCHLPSSSSGIEYNNTCPIGMYGMDCQQQCQCHNDAVCNAIDGTCECRPGWHGRFCDTTCPGGFWGLGCANPCACNNGDSCDIKTGTCECQCENGAVCNADGTCDCTAGWRGRYCDTPCQEGFWGAGCADVCICQKGRVCNIFSGRCECPCKNDAACNVNGACDCTTGWRGRYCETPCPEGFWGPNCRNPCSCHIGQSCDVFTGNCECQCKNGAVCQTDGSCDCTAGWRGRYCDSPCPEGFWGPGCRSTCICRIGETCDKTTGSCNCHCQNGGECNKDGICECTAGWRGRYCDVPCPDGFWGQGCRSPCTCHLSQLLEGRFCDSPCPDGFWGAGCSKLCACSGNEDCDPVSGLCECNCKNGGRCKIDGTCECTAGFRGRLCDAPCPSGFWGTGCLNRCSCQGHSNCSRKNGVCICHAGYTGVDCKTPCEYNKYGENCAHTCRCTNGGVCNSVTGECLCRAGYKGTKCETRSKNNFECLYSFDSSTMISMHR
ncbi:multiple epidermal growth factor-like domains protein 11 [Ptychodera flava]|uniref:multiple epidermal growth factor-like domains protein 11 n=1 Tax=Ptychodera flava TaxID=63121 RepID=UPI003969D77C